MLLVLGDAESHRKLWPGCEQFAKGMERALAVSASSAQAFVDCVRIWDSETWRAPL
jgi:hypothetical protein